MPRVKMLETKKGSPNGIQVNEYVAGREYLLPDSLSDAFLNMEVAELILPPSVQAKSEPAVPKNKAIDVIPEDKEVKKTVSKSEERRKVTMFRNKLARSKN